MKLQDLFEMVASAGMFPEYNPNMLPIIVNRLSQAKPLQQIRDNCTLCQLDNYFVLKKQDQVVGWMMVSDVVINNQPYKHVDMFYIIPEYRKTGAGQWLFFAVRQHFGDIAFVADQGISSGGEGMIISGKLKGYNNMYVLNKKTGEKNKIDNLVIDDPDCCYLFETATLQLGIPTPGFEEPIVFYEYFDPF